MTLVSDESTEDACEWLSGLFVGIGVDVLLEDPIIGLMLGCVVAVGANVVFTVGPETGVIPTCWTPAAPSSLSKGSSVQPSGIVTPGGRSALPAWIAVIFDRTPCLCN